ncbi:MAG: hypothetical protein JWR22_2166 [Herminiimonas sp.]|nr:hypothetical protein [Herminiimonas sp.]
MEDAENHAGHECRVLPLVQCDQQKADRRECRHNEQNWKLRSRSYAGMVPVSGHGRLACAAQHQ